MIPERMTDQPTSALQSVAAQLRKMADSLDSMGHINQSECTDPQGRAGPAFPLPEKAERTSLWQPRPALPDPRLVRRILYRRQQRARFFNPELFADPAWDMILELAAARAEHRRISVTSLCIASGVPTTTALRWIKVLIEEHLAERSDDNADRRRVFIVLTDAGSDLVARYFESLQADFAIQW